MYLTPSMVCRIREVEKSSCNGWGRPYLTMITSRKEMRCMVSWELISISFIIAVYSHGCHLSMFCVSTLTVSFSCMMQNIVYANASAKMVIVIRLKLTTLFCCAEQINVLALDFFLHNYDQKFKKPLYFGLLIYLC